MKKEDENKELSAKAKENLKRNEVLRRKEWGIEPIPPLSQSTLATFNAERIEPLEEEVNGKMVQKFKYIVTTPPMYDSDTGEYELIVDAKTSGHIDAYLSKGVNWLNIKRSRRGKDTRYRIQP